MQGQICLRTPQVQPRFPFLLCPQYNISSSAALEATDCRIMPSKVNKLPCRPEVASYLYRSCYSSHYSSLPTGWHMVSMHAWHDALLIQISINFIKALPASDGSIASMDPSSGLKVWSSGYLSMACPHERLHNIKIVMMLGHWCILLRIIYIYIYRV